MPDEKATKKLSKKIGKEIFLSLNKLSVKFMKNGKTYSSQEATYKLFTIKPIHEDGCNPEIQFHVRMAINERGVDMGLLDVDFYIDKLEWEQKIKPKPKDLNDFL